MIKEQIKYQQEVDLVLKNNELDLENSKRSIIEIFHSGIIEVLILIIFINYQN